MRKHESDRAIRAVIHAYKLGGFNIVLDIASGCIHSVDDVAYDAISALMYESESVAVEQIKTRYRDISDEDISALFEEIAQLKRRGALFSTDNYGEIEKEKSTELKALCLNISHLCNMNCAYCFAGSGDYGGGEGLMSIETAMRAIDFLVENSGSKNTLDIDFFGGEPLLNWGVVKEVVKYARGVEREHGKKFRFTLTTNGLLIDDDVIEFTCEQMHNVVLSLDGRAKTNDLHRLLADGSGSYNVIVPKLKKLVSAREGKGYYIRGTFTKQNCDFVNDILHIADLGFKEISLEPVVSKPGELLAFSDGDLPELLNQYQLLAVKMLEEIKEGRGFAFYHFTLDLTGGPCVHKRIAGCGVGTEYMAVTPGGKLYPCHQFVGDEEFVLGDIWSGIKNNKLREDFGKWNIYSRPECRGCWARLYCSGGCAANAYYDTGSLGSVYKIGCELFKKRLECAIMIKVGTYQNEV